MKKHKFFSSSLISFSLLALWIPTMALGLTAGNTSPKKGAGGAGDKPFEVIRALGISWSYNWWVSPEFFDDGYEYVPMVHKGMDLSRVQNVARNYPGRYWLVFNEPDYYYSDNISPTDGAIFYKELRERIKQADPTAKLIVGGVFYEDLGWLTQFRNEYRRLYGVFPSVEGWHAHLYVGTQNYNKETWRQKITNWKTWMMNNGGLTEFWLTEFGCLQSDAVSLQIMRDQIPWLETEASWISRYAWYAVWVPLENNPYCNQCRTSLTHADDSLTPLGQLFSTFGDPPTPLTYTIRATAGSGGTITPSGVIYVPEGGSQTFTMTPNPGFQIADVMVDGVSKGPISTKTFSHVTSNRTISATFSPLTYSLTITPNGPGAGSVTSSPEGTSFLPGTVVTLTATVDSGSTFGGWSGDCTGTNPTCTLTMNGNKAVTATFLAPAGSQYTLTLNQTGTGTGVVTPNPAGSSFSAGTVVTLTATASAGSTFAGWAEACSGISPTCQVTMNGNLSVTATFVSTVPRRQVVFAVNCGGGGYTDPSGIVYQADRNYSGGSTYQTTRRIKDAPDALVYQSERFGNFSYNIPLPNGTYQLTLKFAEIYSGIYSVGQRVFTVKIEGKEVLSNFDIFRRVRRNRALDQTFPVTVTDGNLHIEFISIANNAKVNAILVTAPAR